MCYQLQIVLMYFMYSIILLGGEILLLEDAIAPPISKSTHTVVVGLEKEGDLNGKGLNRGTLENGVLRGSDKGPKHPASPKHRSCSAPFKRY
jgi:hypothetical protein